MYRLDFEDGSQPSRVAPGRELMDAGLVVNLKGKEVSELIFFEIEQ